MTQVFEIHGGAHARSNGWDFTVCRSLSEAVSILFLDLDALNPDEEIRVISKQYTQAQMDEVVWED